MDPQRQENHERLRDVGVITSDELPEHYHDVIDALTPDELEMLVSIKKRLDGAEEASGISIGDNFVAP